jgi:hypothetical protein
MNRTTDQGDSALKEEMAGLRERLAELTVRLQTLEGDDTNGDGRVSSRRDLLKLAGAVAAGAAGGLVLRPIPAAATAGGNVILGGAATTNDSNVTTHLGPTAASTPSPIVSMEGQAPPSFPASPAATSKTAAVSLPVLLVLAPHGVFPTNTVGGITLPVFPGHAPLQSVGGVVDFPQLGGPTLHLTEGVNGHAAVDSTDANARGAGGIFTSDFGVGVLGAGATDLGAFGSGALSQLSIVDNTGAAIAGPPASRPQYDFAQVRDMNGVLWLSGVGGNWRRDNTVRVDNTAGTGPFAPARVLDTRSSIGTTGSSPALGANQPLQPGVTYTFGPFPGFHGLPADAIGIVGNVTVVNFTGAGYLSLFPGGAPDPGTSSINFGPPFASSGWANAFTLGFGTGGNAGKVSIRLSNNGITSHVILDVTAYIQ